MAERLMGERGGLAIRPTSAGTKELLQERLQLLDADGEIENGETTAKRESLPEAGAEPLARDPDLLRFRGGASGLQHPGEGIKGNELLAQSLAKLRPDGAEFLQLASQFLTAAVLRTHLACDHGAH